MLVVKPEKCGRCGREYNSGQIRQCPHQGVVKRFGGKMCMYCCYKCKHNVFANGSKCIYTQFAQNDEF